MAITKYRTLSDDELIAQIGDRRQHSPIVDELCNRLEARGGAVVLEDSNHRVECPVCEAQLEADYDEGNTMFSLKVEK